MFGLSPFLSPEILNPWNFINDKVIRVKRVPFVIRNKSLSTNTEVMLMR